MTRADWIDALGREHVLEVAHALGLEVQRPRGASGGSFACPACNAERRHASRGDRRLACGVRADGTGWRCFECDVSGDQLHLVAVSLCGARFDALDAAQKTRVRGWVEEWTRTGSAPASDERPRLDLVAGDATPHYPASDDVLEFLRACKVVTADQRISSWLERTRRISPRRVADLGLAAALKWGTPCPSWARTGAADDEGRPWSETGYRLLAPMVDHEGRLRNVLARYVGKPKSERAPKSRAAKGFNRRGLVLADDPARAMLAGVREIERVIVCEGEMDWLAFATQPGSGAGRAVIGIVSGSWTAELAARVPDGATVVIATHRDADGEKYARAIAGSFAQRARASAVRVQRWRSAA